MESIATNCLVPFASILAESTPPNYLVPFGTILAALIAGFFSFLNLVISKEQKVSEFRQAWIDKLREEISNYVASITYLASANEVWASQGRQDIVGYYKASQEAFEAASRNFTSAVLRINPADGDKEMRAANEEFLTTLKSVRDLVRKSDYNGAKQLADTLSAKAQPILKKEWERVKQGEPIYRLTRYAAAVIIVLCLLSGSFLAYHAYHRQPAQAPASPNQR